MTNYTLTGKGKLILLLHGWGDSTAGLAELTKALNKNFRVLAVDLPGFGATQVPKETWDLDNYSEFLKELLKKLELDQPYTVIGHSNGGALAIRALSLKELQPKKLVLLAASGIRNNKQSKMLILKIIAKTGNIATIWMPERYRQSLRKSLYDTAGSDMLVAPQLEETFKKTVKQDVQADAKQIKVPTLLIYGADDQAVPAEYGLKFNNLIAGSQVVIIPNAGHFVHKDASQKVTEQIEDFLK